VSGAEFPAAVTAIAALGDPTRRALYRYIAAQSVPVGREDAAAAVGVPHHVARFHLDRLPEVVCRMNLALIASALDAAGARTASAHLDPAEGRCCVTVRLADGEPGPPA
jgi:predicted ArsR family transcriptional regulator